MSSSVKEPRRPLLSLGDSNDECDETPVQLTPFRETGQRPSAVPSLTPPSPPSSSQAPPLAAIDRRSDWAVVAAAPVVVTAAGREFEPSTDSIHGEQGSDSAAYPTEIFRYKVVYPGGVCVRVSPAIDAEKTGDILEYGSTFRSNKSLFLDGINYCKIADYDGWVFSSIDDTEVLQLLEVVRTPIKSSMHHAMSKSPMRRHAPNSLSAADATDGDSTSSMAGRLSNMAIFMSPEALSRKLGGYSSSQLAHAPISGAQLEKRKLLDANRAQNRFWREMRAACGECSGFEGFVRLAVGISHAVSDEKAGGDEQLRGLLGIIASITNQCAESQVDLAGLEPCLWVLTHLGSRVSHIMSLVVVAANERFDSIAATSQKDLLCMVLEVGLRTKAQCVEVGRAADMLPDDLRNFLQRWVILRFNEPDAMLFKGQSSDSEDSPAVTRTPVAEKGSGSSVSSWFAELLCSSGSGPFAPSRPKGLLDFSAGSLATEERQEGSYSRSRFWSVVEREMRQMSNTELQSALF